MKWFLKVLNQYADFNGRARRKEYWMFTLIYILFLVAAAVLDNLFGIAFDQIGYGPLYLLLSLGLFIPNLAVSIRRLHDIGKSGWMILVGIIPIVGIIWLIVLFATDSQPDRNEYGPNPKSMNDDGMMDDTLDGHLVG